MGNPYLKHCKYAQNPQYGGFFDDQVKLISSFWGTKGVSGGLTEFATEAQDTSAGRAVTSAAATAYQTVMPTAAAAATHRLGSGAHIKKGTDGWATYFWDSGKNLITYVNPDTGRKIAVSPGSSGWQYLTSTPKIRWSPSNPASMAAQKSQTPRSSSSTALVPLDEMDDLGFPEDKNVFEKAVDYAQEKPLVVGGVSAAIVAVLFAPFAIRKIRGSTNEHGLVSLMDASGGTIQLPPETPRWTYKVVFQDSEEYGPYVVEPIQMTAKQAAEKKELTFGDPTDARMSGQDDVERFRNKRNEPGPMFTGDDPGSW